MKRKRSEVVPIKTELKETRTVNKTSPRNESLNLKTVCTITYPSELSSAFCLQSVNEFIMLRSKTDIEIMKFEKTLGNHKSKINLSCDKFGCSNYEVVESLKVNENRLFNTSNNIEKNEIMLNPILFPKCIVKNNHQLVKCQLSPCSSQDNIAPLVASLSSHGSLAISIYRHDNDTNENSLVSVAELCEVRKTSFSLGATYVKFSKLQEIVNELTFANFEWCPEMVDSKRIIAAVTKTNEIIICSVNTEGEVVVQQSEKFDEVISELKWIVFNQQHFLFVGSTTGDLTRFSMDVTVEGEVETLVNVDKMKGKLRIPVFNMQAECSDDSILIVCAKAHSLEVFLITESVVESITQHVGLNITGLVSVSNSKPEYLVTTLDNKVFFIELSSKPNDLKIVRFVNVDNSNSSEIQPTKYASYGVTASKNKVLVLLALYPKTMFDHLVLKQPLSISINMLSNHNPYRMLMENESLQLTELYDCVEAVRFVGSTKLETLAELESMNYTIAFSEEYLYYLKIQMIVVEARLMYYQSRSDMSFETITLAGTSIKRLIEVINAFFLLKFIIGKKKKQSEQTELSVRCLSYFIRNFIKDKMIKEPFTTAQETLKTGFEELLEKCKVSTDKPEICLYCFESIEDEKLTCKLNHPIARCIITKIQIPIGMNHFCSNCNCGVVDLETLRDVTGRDQSFLCPFCDQRFTFT